MAATVGFIPKKKNPNTKSDESQKPDEKSKE